MVMKKACCCCSTRVGTLIFLYIYLIENIWKMICLLTPFVGTSIFEAFLESHDFVHYTLILIVTVGSLIYLAAIISVHNYTPSKSLLIASAVFLVLSMIHEIYTVFLLSGDEEALFVAEAEEALFDAEAEEALFDAEAEESIKKLSPRYDRDQARAVMKNLYRFQLRVIQFTTAIFALIVIYSLVVIHAYINNAETNRRFGSSGGRIISEGANHPGPSTYHHTVQYLAQPPQYLTQPPQYLTQPPQYPYPVSQGLDMPSKM